ncbi:hypothetical protein TWF730_005272 [Orbilia blumenaviensis]|uniref:DNA topoisomerase (ATP-hydrolyzing) n=1 Tax=Orbilia blumenaviensis TaxID=1796055 RepID=A0AAV9VHW5_9PEZI
MSSNPEDPYDLELFSVIDLYQDQTSTEDGGSEYFGWSDEDAVEDISIGVIDESQFLDLTTPVFPTTAGGEVQSTMSTDILNAEILPPIQPVAENLPAVSLVLPLTTQNVHKIPRSTAPAPAATLITDSITDHTINPPVPELSLEDRLHKIFIENRRDKTTTITWEEPDNSSRPSTWVLEKIDQVFTAFLDVIDDKSKLVVKLRGTERRMLHLKSQPKWVWRTLVYPGPSARDNQKFGAFLRILELVREAIKLDRIYTKRDIYYKDVALFGSQRTVNNLVDDIASALGVPRRSLHITAAAKGLVCGDLDISKTDGSIINCNIEGEGVLIPSSTDIEKVVIRDCDTALIIEKEAIFRTLAESGDWKRLPGRPILICGKGYPDIATREFAHYLYLTKNVTGRYLDFYCLVDYDPHGLDIYTMYKNGSLLSRAAGMFYEQMAVPALQHLGVKFSDILEYCSAGSGVSQNIEDHGQDHTGFNLAAAVGAGEDEEQPRNDDDNNNHKRARYTHLPPQGLLQMTAHDRAKAVSMLQRDCSNAMVEHADDLRKLLFVGYKAEIQVLGDQLVRYLDEKLDGQRIGLAS